MMRSLALILAVLLAGCDSQRQPQNAPTIIIYESMMREWAKVTCAKINLLASNETPAQKNCKEETESKQAEFSLALRAYLESEPICHSVKFAIKDIKTEKVQPRVTGPAWFFHVYFNPGAITQSWDLDPAGPGPRVGGKGDEAHIARTICSIVTNRGGTFLN
jgi:hypothetical protein